MFVEIYINRESNQHHYYVSQISQIHKESMMQDSGADGLLRLGRRVYLFFSWKHHLIVKSNSSLPQQDREGTIHL